jgi:hypothetical protein
MTTELQKAFRELEEDLKKLHTRCPSYTADWCELADSLAKGGSAAPPHLTTKLGFLILGGNYVQAELLIRQLRREYNLPDRSREVFELFAKYDQDIARKAMALQVTVEAIADMEEANNKEEQ